MINKETGQPATLQNISRADRGFLQISTKETLSSLAVSWRLTDPERFAT
jgi:hypothetical protein